MLLSVHLCHFSNQMNDGSLHISGCIGSDTCCTQFNQCGIGEGDCDSDEDCKGKFLNTFDLLQYPFLIGDLYCKKDSCGTKAPFDSDNSDDCCQSRKENIAGKFPIKALIGTQINMDILFHTFYVLLKIKRAYILKASPMTPTGPQKNLNFPQICPNMPRNGPKMAKSDKT